MGWLPEPQAAYQLLFLRDLSLIAHMSAARFFLSTESLLAFSESGEVSDWISDQFFIFPLSLSGLPPVNEREDTNFQFAEEFHQAFAVTIGFVKRFHHPFEGLDAIPQGFAVRQELGVENGMRGFESGVALL